MVEAIKIGMRLPIELVKSKRPRSRWKGIYHHLSFYPWGSGKKKEAVARRVVALGKEIGKSGADIINRDWVGEARYHHCQHSVKGQLYLGYKKNERRNFHYTGYIPTE